MHVAVNRTGHCRILPLVLRGHASAMAASKYGQPPPHAVDRVHVRTFRPLTLWLGPPYVWYPNLRARPMIPPDAPDHPTPPHPKPADVGRAMAAALATGGSTTALERLVRGYVRALKDADVAPEQALKRLKVVVGVSTVTPIPGRGPLVSDRLADDVVAWFVSEYYQAD